MKHRITGVLSMMGRLWLLLLGVTTSMANPVLTVLSNGACDNAVDKSVIHNRLNTIKCNPGLCFCWSTFRWFALRSRPALPYSRGLNFRIIPCLLICLFAFMFQRMYRDVFSSVYSAAIHARTSILCVCDAIQLMPWFWCRNIIRCGSLIQCVTLLQI